MAQTLKNISDSIFEMLTKFARTDEEAVDETWMAYKINQIRSELIQKEYAVTGMFNETWLSDVGLLTFYKVNTADNISVTCGCEIAKTTVPQTVNLISKNGNSDLGIFSLTSTCGKYQYTPKPMFRWGSNTPSWHTNSLFNYYFRINTSLYVSNTPTQLRMIAVLLDPTEGKLINSASVASGSIASGTVYYVSGSQIVYNSIVRAPGTTFTGVGGQTTYTGAGTVYLNSQVSAYRNVDPYPASGEMIRQIELEILTKEFNIEKQAVIDVRNDSVDDANK